MATTTITNNRTPVKNPPITKSAFIRQSRIKNKGVPAVELFLRGGDDNLDE